MRDHGKEKQKFLASDVGKPYISSYKKSNFLTFAFS